MASLFVLMGVSGDDVYARHVGMSVSPMSASGPAAEGRPRMDRDARSSDPAAPPARPQHGTGEAETTAHVLHLLGACLAVLAAAVLLHPRGWWLVSVRVARALIGRLDHPASWLAGVRRGPPRLDPPRFSPVMRT
jgi:hypothetical protein